MAWDVRGEELEVGRAGGVVRDDCFDDAVGFGVALEFVPQGVLVVLGADGRAALVAGVAVADLLGGQGEIVVAGLCGDVYALGAGLAQERDDLHGGEVDNVQREVGGQVGQGEDLLYSSGLIVRRARGQERGVRLRGTLRHDVRGFRRVLVGDHLGVEHERGGLIGQLQHGLLDIL